MARRSPSSPDAEGVPEPDGAPHPPASPDPRPGEVRRGLIPNGTSTLPNPPISIDTKAAQTARMGDFLRGGSANFAVDRDVTQRLTTSLPGGSDAARASASAGYAFQGRSVRYLAGEVGIRQFLSLANMVPPTNAVHEVAQEIAPDARVVYIMSDDTALAHAHLLQDGAAEGTVSYARVPGRLRQPRQILDLAGQRLDFSQPVAVLLSGSLHHIPDDAEAQQAVRAVLQPLCSDSYLTLIHLASDLPGDAMAEAIDRHEHLVQEAKMPELALRAHDQVSRFFDGLELVEPGVVPVHQWRPESPPSWSQWQPSPPFGGNTAEPTAPPPPDQADVFIYGGVGRKP